MLDKKIMARRPNGAIEIIWINPLILIKLQKGRTNFDLSGAIEWAISTRFTLEDVDRILTHFIDIAQEDAKNIRLGWPDLARKGAHDYFVAYNNGGVTLDTAIALVAAKDLWWAVKWKAFNADEVPNGENHPLRSFRNALDFDESGLKFEMTRAREIKKDELRTLRAKKLIALDVEFQRAYKDSAKLDQIEAQKQALRDITNDPAINAAKTPEELKAFLPDILK